MLEYSGLYSPFSIYPKYTVYCVKFEFRVKVTWIVHELLENLLIFHSPQSRLTCIKRAMTYTKRCPPSYAVPHLPKLIQSTFPQNSF